MTLGFLLHPTYRIESGRAVVHLFGKLETGETFVVRDRRSRPHFFIRAEDAQRARAHLRPGCMVEPTSLATMGGDAVARVTVPTPPDAPTLRDQLLVAGIAVFEGDVPFATRFLIDHGLRGSMRIEGAWRPGRLVGRIYEDPDLAPAEWDPTLSTLSIDIETDAAVTRVLSIALYGPSVSEVHLVHPGGGTLPPAARPHADERSLLEGFAKRLREIDPDILLGWNLIDFDLSVLRARFLAHRLPFYLGRADIPCAIRVERSFWGASRATIPGRVALDGVALLRGAFIRLEDYRLDTAARLILGEGKTVAGHGRAAWIEQAFADDIDAFVHYNLTDARLAHEIVEKLDLIPLGIRRSRLTGMPLDRVGASIASFDFLYLHELRKRGIVAPTVDAEIETESTAGGHVLESEPGLYRNILVFDYRSLYPSLILTFHLDPLSHVSEPDGEGDLLRAPNDACFRRSGGILPELLERLMPEREAAKRRGDDIGAQATKILMNSFYGVLGTPRCRFYSPATANAITRFGQTILLWTKSFMEARGYRVLYGDTDSLFVQSGLDDAAEASRLGAELAEEVNAAVAEFILSTWRTQSRLCLQFDRLYERFFLPGLRHSREGSKKRYAGLVHRDGEERIVFTGLESARSDWTELAKRFQRELLERVFHDEPVEDFIRGFVGDLRAGRLDELLAYRRVLRTVDEAGSRTPLQDPGSGKGEGFPGPAREAGRRKVTYRMTIRGPEPVEEATSPPDYDHYVEKQIRPIAEAVLACLGGRWDRIWSGQEDLFS
jgi:DNA polymerase II